MPNKIPGANAGGARHLAMWMRGGRPRRSVLSLDRISAPGMSIFASQFRKVHFYILLAFAAAFSALTFWALIHQSPSDWRDHHNFAATLLTVFGPFTGAIARPSETSCLRFAWGLFPYCAGILSLAVIFQFIRLPLKRGAKAMQIVLWVLGLLGWFGGGVLSLMFALS